jgi:hypothetical protein
MKKSMPRIISALLAALLAVVSCACSTGAGTGAADDTKPQAQQTEPETEKLYRDDIPEDIRFGGETIRFVSAGEKISIAIDDTVDDIADPVNESVWKRNIAL